jgi:hypothetical protein
VVQTQEHDDQETNKHEYNFLQRQWHTIKMGNCKKDKIKNKVLNKFKHAIYGGVHANNWRTFKKTHLDQSPYCCNPSPKFTTKARACKGEPKMKHKSLISCSWECKKV